MFRVVTNISLENVSIRFEMLSYYLDFSSRGMILGLLMENIFKLVYQPPYRLQTREETEENLPHTRPEAPVFPALDQKLS